MKPFFLLLSLLLLVSCKSSIQTPINTGSDEAWTGAPGAEVLVAMRIESPSIRRLFEDQMTAALTAEGVTAVPSYTVIPAAASIDASMIQRFVATSPKLAVLFAEAAIVRKEESKSESDDGSVFDELMGIGGWEVTFVASMEDALYVHGRPNAVWWSRVRVEAEEEKLYQAAEKYVKSEIALLKASGVIDRLK